MENNFTSVASRGWMAGWLDGWCTGGSRLEVFSSLMLEHRSNSHSPLADQAE